MKEKNQVVPDELLSKEFLSRFKAEADVSKFLKRLHAQRYWKGCLKVKWMPIWVMKRIPWPAITVAIHAMAVIRRGYKPNMEKLSFPFHVTATAGLSR